MKILCLLALSIPAIGAQIVPGRYVVELSGEPAAMTAGRWRPRASMGESELNARRAQVLGSQSNARRAIEDAGGAVIGTMDTIANALLVSIPDARAGQLSSIPGVVKLHAVYRVGPLLNHALPIHKVQEAWNTLPQDQNSAGAGIRIAAIDSGIDVHHPAFADQLPALDGFPKMLLDSDRQFTNAKIIVAKNYTSLLPDGGEPDADDYDGHGTGTAMAAAGAPVNSAYGTLSGVAPKAYLGSYKVLDSDGSTSDVIAKAIDDAVADGMDVINISLGAYVTSFADIDPGEIGITAIENAARAGVIVCVAAGNSGPGAGSVDNYGSAPDAIAVGAIMNDRALSDAINIAGVPAYQAFPGDGPNPGAIVQGALSDVAAVDSTGLACSLLPPASASRSVLLILRGVCTFETKLNNAASAGAIGAIIYNDAAGTPFSLGDSTVGSATIPAMFTNQAQGTDLKARLATAASLPVTLDFSGRTAFPTSADLSDFSSRGPSAVGAMKPDLVAVGNEIVTGAQSTYFDGNSYDQSGFIDTGGTSFSAPLVAGAAAVLKAARPNLTFQQYRSLLVNSASLVSAGPGGAATVQQAGAGMLNLAAVLGATVSAYPTSLNFGTGAGSVNTTLDLTLSNIGAVPDTFSISVAPAGNGPAPVVSAAAVQLAASSAQRIQVTVNAASLAGGEYQGYLRVTGTATPISVNIPYWFAVPGSDPAGISILYSDPFDSARTLTTGAVVFRIVDVAGLPYSGSLNPHAAVIAGGGNVGDLYAIGDIPGTFALDLRTGNSTMKIAITIGNVTNSVVIPVF